jgi:hypothetical protein
MNVSRALSGKGKNDVMSDLAVAAQVSTTGMKRWRLLVPVLCPVINFNEFNSIVGVALSASGKRLAAHVCFVARAMHQC